MKSVVTIGTFDGVHRGHQLLLSQVSERARELDARSVAVTFEPVPVSVLRPDAYRGRICSVDEKLHQIHLAGIDQVDVIEFTLDLAAKSPEEFISELVDRLDMIEVWVGDDFALGRNRSGNVDVIREIGQDLGYTTVAIERIADGDRPISSTAIRKAIEIGDVSAAALMLGRPFRISGEVIHGAHLGRTIGFPTANFVPPPGMIQLADGIYASFAVVPSETFARPAMTYVGTRPTVDGEDRQVETNILDFDGDLYGKVLIVDLIERVRGDQTFDGLEPLIAQLKNDEVAIRGILEPIKGFAGERVAQIGDVHS